MCFWALDKSYSGHGTALRVAQVLDQLYYMGLLVLGGAALTVAAWGRWRGDMQVAPLLVLGCIPAFVTITAFGFTGQTRYHYPAMPCLILAAGWTLALLLRRAAAGRGVAVKRTLSPA